LKRYKNVVEERYINVNGEIQHIQQERISLDGIFVDNRQNLYCEVVIPISLLKSNVFDFHCFFVRECQGRNILDEVDKFL